METLTEERRLELEDIIRQMKAASNIFYSTAVKIGVHQFIEFNGLLTEYINVCRRMLSSGIDFQTNQQRPLPENMHYVAEKLECIWGAALANPELMTSFLCGLHHLPVPQDELIVLRLEPKPEEQRGGTSEEGEETRTEGGSLPSGERVLPDASEG